jgi:aminoglycoside phosphotransferase (APT) family kinase protein
MGARSTPLSAPAFEALLGDPPEEVITLANLGYRATWKVRAGATWFCVKSDTREGFQRAEFEAHLHAAASGVPVPECVAFIEMPLPTLAMRWVDGVSLRHHGVPEAWRAAGRVLRAIHHSRLLREPEGRWADSIIDWLTDGLSYLIETRRLSTGVADAVLARARAMYPAIDVRPPAWLHGDCQDAHFVLNPASDSVTAVLDWADALAGDPVLDMAVLTLSQDVALPHLLDGYGADSELRAHVSRTLGLYRVVRGMAVIKWLDEHGYQAETWPERAIRSFVESRSS